MMKYNKIATITKMVEGDFIPVMKFTVYEKEDWNVFRAMHKWINENIPEVERDFMYCAVQTVEEQTETNWH